MKLQVVLALVMSLGLAACSEPGSPTPPVSEQDAGEPARPAPEGEREGEEQSAAETDGDEKPERPAEPAAAIPPPVPLPADLWRSAPSELTVGETVVTLNSRLWLRRLPVIGADGTAPSDLLHGAVKLQTQAMQPLPQPLEIQRVLLMQGDQQWLVKESLDIQAEGELTLEVSLSEGPEWLPGSAVDIVVQLSHQGEEMRLIQHDVIIGPLRTGD